MKTYKKFLNESKLLQVYRGFKKVAGSKMRNPDIIWVSTSLKHAKMYSDGGTVTKYTIDELDLDTLDLGFRVAETDVTFDEVRGRLVDRIMDRYEHNKVTAPRASKLVGDLDTLQRMKSISGHKPVWDWMYEAGLLVIVKEAGYTAIAQREEGTVTYGIIDHSILVPEGEVDKEEPVVRRGKAPLKKGQSF